MSLQGKTVLVTGAARRIGQEIALAMANAGADVAITYLTSEQQAVKTLIELRSKGVRALACHCDVRDAESVRCAVAEVVAEFGGLDVLVNNAAVYETVDFDQITVEQWDRMFTTNVRGPFLVARAALEVLRARKGKIINIGSLGGVRPWATHAHYCASKAALQMLTQVMAKALAPEIAVNCVAPGMIHAREAPESDFLHHIAEMTPMKRPGTPSDVVGAVLYLAETTHFVTGQTILVDGGLSL
jgi:3-oxoacyl-[acyl-carrier protein] reductase/pteridine reductase